MDSIFDTEHLYRSYFKLSAPIVLSMVISLVYNLADTFFIAQTGSTALIAGVSVCSPVFTALMAFGNIYGQGGSSLISRLLGQKDEEGTKNVSAFSFYAALLTGVLLAVLMLLFRTPMLTILGADGETLPHAIQYYTVLAVGAPIIVLSFIHSNLVRCEGMATQSMIGSILGTVVNIILDPILISGFGMGAFGAAVATIIGYLCNVLYFLWILHRCSRALSVSPKRVFISASAVGQIFGIGITAALSNLMQSLSVIMINQFLLPYGSDRIAAMGIVMKVSMIVVLILTGFSFGGVPLYGYLFGAGQKEELRKLLRFCLSFLSALALVLTVVIFLGASPIMGVFVQDSSIIALGTQMLRWQVITSVFAGIVLLLTVLFQATGQVLPSFFLSISRQGVIFLLVLWLCTALFQYTGILVAQAVADVISALFALLLLRRTGKIILH